MNCPGPWYCNVTLWSGIAAWVVAQIAKLLVNMYKTHRFDHGFLLRLGGMPSSHSASVVAVATSAGLRLGFDSVVFAVALALALIVMVDAQSVRRAAGQQARLLNQLVQELFKEHHLSQQKLVEFLGHTRMEVLLGALLGIPTTLICHALMVK
ncbi:MAG: Divergent PAP2 family protein [Verrucomicrobia bacterium ADurb.Bin345]|nr:MAG: Divergent PAP2 family protein [Verrucomicrobia bacterium ADurb.Bin345]